MDTALQLTPLQVALAALLLGVQVLLSLALKLKLARSYLWAGLRMSLQLSLIGLILTWVFAQQSWIWVLVLLGIMTLLAGQASNSRVKERYRGMYLDSTLSIFLSAWLTTAYFLAVVSRPEPWFLPQYVIPLLGMILGNGISGVALGLDRFLTNARNQRLQIESFLALGANRWEAGREASRDAIRTGLIPIMNSMMASGLVSLPGMMTGQILGGVPPSQAVRYQIVIMFMIASSTTLGTVGTVLLAQRRLLNAEHRLRLDLLK